MSEAIVFEVDGSNRITSWPREAVEAFGSEPAAALGRSWVELAGAHDVAGNRLCPRSCGLHAMARAGESIGVFEIIASTSPSGALHLFGRAEPLGSGGQRGLRFAFWRDRRRLGVERKRDERRDAAADRRLASPLTARETEVLRLLSRGHRIEEVAELLSISAHTVRNHAQRALPKLGASSRAQAVSIAIRRGLI
jgi:DNA-binding CsgD family transcriptional regulator